MLVKVLKNKIINKDRIFKIFQSFLTCFYILGETIKNFNRKPSLKEWSIATILILLLIAVIYSFLKRKFRKNNAAWILTILFTIWIYSYEEILLQLSDWNAILANILYFSVFIFLYKIALLFVNKPLIRANQLLSIGVILYSFLGLSDISLKFKSFEKQNQSVTKISYTDSINKPPNIYLFLLDAYSGQESLKKNLNFDNSAFIDSLKQKGFYHFENSRSNYKSTIYSVTSFFMQDALPSNLLQTTSNKQNRLRVGKMENILANGNTLATKLEAKGYNFYNLSLFNVNHHPPKYPRLFYTDWNSFWINSLFQTFYGSFIGFLSQKRWIRNFTIKPEFVGRQIFNDIDSIASSHSDSPKFVYLHSLAIHSPFIYVDEPNFKTGLLECLFDDPVKNREEKYLSALRSLNNRVLKSVNNILKNDSNATILIFSDHGARVLPDSTLYSNLMCFYNCRIKENRSELGLNEINSLTNFLKQILNSN